MSDNDYGFFYLCYVWENCEMVFFFMWFWVLELIMLYGFCGWLILVVIKKFFKIVYFLLRFKEDNFVSCVWVF